MLVWLAALILTVPVEAQCAGYHQKLSIPVEATFRETIQLPGHRPQYHSRHLYIAKAYEWHRYMWHRAGERPHLSTTATGKQILR